MPFISCSIREVTVSSVTCALAPGKTAVICRAGGATSGYCETGSLGNTRIPPSTMNSAMTQAKMGRSIKKRGSMGEVLTGRNGLHRHAGTGLLHAVDNDLLAAFEAFRDDPVRSGQPAGFHRLGNDLAIRTHD